jgi:signal peptidase II
LKNLQSTIYNLQSNAIPVLKSQIIFWFLAAGGIILDLWSKKAAFDWLNRRQNMEFSVIEGVLRLIQVQNGGAAWGMLQGRNYFLSAVSIVALIIILGIFFFSKHQPVLVHISLGLLAAGVFGNLYDRVFNGGQVRDFIDVYYRQYHWPTFNVADILLSVGVGLLIISTILTDWPGQKRAPQQK